jgi:hypothetical protein
MVIFHNFMDQILLKKLEVTQLLKKFLTFYGTQTFIIVFTRIKL